MKLSIITINFNNASGLLKTIQSVITQKFRDYEYLIVDGGSTDDSLSILNVYSDEITSWISEPDAGIYNAMNKGIAKAKGEYLLFLNSGDFLSHDRILDEINVYLFDFDLIYGNLIIDTGQKRSEHSFPKKISFEYFLLNTIPHPCTFIKRSLFEIVGLYNENLKIVSDWEFFIKAVCKFNCSYKQVEKLISVINTDGISYDPRNTGLIAKEKENSLETYFSYIIKDYQDVVRPNAFRKMKHNFKSLSISIKNILKKFILPQFL